MPKLIPVFEIWYPVPEEHAPGRVCVRHIEDGEAADIQRMSTDVRTVYDLDSKTGKNESRYDLTVDCDEALDRAITAWEDFSGFKGEELECTRKNKLLYACQGWFRPFIAECRRTVKKEFDAKHGKKSTTSESSPSGSQGSDV